MTVRELIEELEEIADKNLEVTDSEGGINNADRYMQR